MFKCNFLLEEGEIIFYLPKKVACTNSFFVFVFVFVVPTATATAAHEVAACEESAEAEQALSEKGETQ